MEVVARFRSARGRGEVCPGTLSLLACIVVPLAMSLLGAIQSEQDLLVFVGFDPDRGILITALTTAGVAALVAGGITGQRRLPAVFGLIPLAAIFGPTFREETRLALEARGNQGSFDPVGWALTVVTLVVTGLVIGWAMATIGEAVRSSLRLTWRRTRRLVAARGRTRLGNGRVLATMVIAALLVGSTAALANLINYSPDTLFHVGNSGFGLFGGGPTPSEPAAETMAPGTEGPDVHPTPGSSAAPAPSGPGRIVAADLPAPWTGGSSTASVTVYLPGGYDTTGLRYPVVYLVPWAYSGWQQGTGIKDMLDGMISSGQLPPTIVVFASTDGDPLVDSECVDSFDRTSMVETYLTVSLPQWVDTTYRTLSDARHRTVLGFSQGGFCSTMLTLRHPDVFNQAVSFGGYYTAGLHSGQTVNAWRPFGPPSGSQNRLAAHSPILLVRVVAPDVRSQLFMYVSGSPDQPFYGDQYRAFKAELKANGVPSITIDTPVAHSWIAVRADLPRALQAVASVQATRASASPTSPPAATSTPAASAAP
jgi:enterochelin esterase-like enzyme